MGDLSAHFSRSEFRCHHCDRLPAVIEPALVKAVEALRAKAFPHGLVVRSGYRCQARQDQLHWLDPTRAARRSQHSEGAAIDFDPVSLDVVLALDIFSGVGWQYVGGRPMAVHGDVRHASGYNPTGGTVTHPTVWQYR